MNQSYCSLGFLSQKSLWKLSTFCGYKGIYSRACDECEKSFFCKTEVSGDSLATGTSCEFQSQNNWLAKLSFLSYSAPAVMTLQLPACFTRVVFWRVISRKLIASFNCENALECTHTLEFFTLLHTQLLHDSYLNSGDLIAEIQVNLVQNKATHGWINSTLQIQMQKNPIGRL